MFALSCYQNDGLCCQKQVSQAGISNCIPQYSVGGNYLFLPEKPASGNKVNYLFLPEKPASGNKVIYLFLTDIPASGNKVNYLFLAEIAASGNKVNYLFLPDTPVSGNKVNCIPQYSVGCNYLSLPEIPSSGNKVLSYSAWFTYGRCFLFMSETKLH